MGIGKRKPSHGFHLEWHLKVHDLSYEDRLPLINISMQDMSFPLTYNY